MDRVRRVNGLESPYTPAQLSTWVYLPTLVLEFLFFASPLLPLAASVPCSVVFVISAAASAYYGYTAMSTDPADPRLPSQGPQHGHDHDNGHEHAPNAGLWGPNEPTKQCWLCDVQVGEKSMHCKFCNKCVDQFDHHCMWLNTCVGKANYAYFFRTMVWITVMLSIHGAIQLALVLDIYLGNGGSEMRAEDWFNADATLAVVIVMCVFIFMDLVALSLILQLLLFHVRLQKEGLSTYQFIVRDNKRKREQAQQEIELVAPETDSGYGEGGEEGRTGDYMRLRYGGLLRQSCGITCCDPLEKEQRIEADAREAGGPPVANGKGIGNGIGNGHHNVPVRPSKGENEESKEAEENT
eukprot:CAMPEP_0117035728 /NCGR_PEP_ID=MMETSP0472-20121206/25359_1 /TAXON_ID=693140 ORGANISM="Tiarina fusus, Strain LIS" /NCGR_SAMPLE_ID=MMETSP0472 /ASSEMBLY_ACC=CAM_ASM_000603 /LENGTH=352 /DNA_ID=CAMNT_0004745289 /DNA_START=254 /DNA_END=1313 /DNA_ORIENTATION=-